MFAVDGCRFSLQRSVELATAFGVPHGGHCPQALVSVLYDVIGGVPCAATIAPGASCERRELRAGKEPWFLLTSLRRALVTLAQMSQLYHLRWAIEEFFKLLKSDYFTQRQFHAKSALGVEQEIRAQLLFAAIARLIAAEAAKATNVPLHDIVTKSSVLALAEHVVQIFLLDDRQRSVAHHPRLLGRVARRRVRRRPNRSCPRVSFKPGPRWDSKGKV